MVGEDDRDPQVAAVAQRQPAAEERVVDMHQVHLLQPQARRAPVAEPEVKPRCGDRHPRAAVYTRLVVDDAFPAEGEYLHLVPDGLEGALVQTDVVRHPADMGFVHVDHHPDAHLGVPQEVDQEW